MPSYLDLLGLKRDRKGRVLCQNCGAPQKFGLGQAYRFVDGRWLCQRCADLNSADPMCGIHGSGHLYDSPACELEKARERRAADARSSVVKK